MILTTFSWLKYLISCCFSKANSIKLAKCFLFLCGVEHKTYLRVTNTAAIVAAVNLLLTHLITLVLYVSLSVNACALRIVSK